MAEDVKLNISGNMSRLKSQLSKADSDVSKTKGKLTQLKTQIKQTESKMAQMRSQFRAQAGGIMKGAGAAALGTAVGLASQEYFTSNGMEGSFWAGLGTAVAVGSMAGPAGAVAAALAVSISKLFELVTALANKQKAIDAKINDVAKTYMAMDKDARAHRRQLDYQLGQQWLSLEKLVKQKEKIMSENIAKQIILQEM